MRSSSFHWIAALLAVLITGGPLVSQTITVGSHGVLVETFAPLPYQVYTLGASSDGTVDVDLDQSPDYLFSVLAETEPPYRRAAFLRSVHPDAELAVDGSGVPLQFSKDDVVDLQSLDWADAPQDVLLRQYTLDALGIRYFAGPWEHWGYLLVRLADETGEIQYGWVHLNVAFQWPVIDVFHVMVEVSETAIAQISTSVAQPVATGNAIYPSVAQHSLHWQSALSHLVIHDLYGRPVFDRAVPQSPLPIGILPAGLYVARYRVHDKPFIQRIFISNQ